MKLNKLSVEYAAVTVSASDGAALDEVTLSLTFLPNGVEPDPNTVWFDAEYVADVNRFRVLLAGSGIGIPPANSHKLPAGKYVAWAKLIDGAETIVRRLNTITIA